jgi:hypothetical protein
MKEKLLILFKSDSLWTQIAATTFAAVIIWIITFLIGIFKGLDYISSIQWTWSILNIKINMLTILAILVIVVGFFRWNNKKIATKIQKGYYTKDEINNKFKDIVTQSQFEGFTDVYDYRRLKNHPWHDLYVDNGDNIKSFKYMMWYGKYKKDSYKIENGIRGLIAEVKEQNYIHASTKTDIINELKDCFPNEYNSYKEELISLLNETKTI